MIWIIERLLFAEVLARQSGPTRMINLRIIGSIWIISAIAPAIQLAIELWSLATHHPSALTPDAQGAAFWITQIFVQVAFLLIVVTGVGMILLRRWAVLAGGILGVISLLVCLWFIATQGMQQGKEPYVVIWCGVVLSLYTIFGVWRFRRHNRLA
jgi:hypothetical protein